MNDDRLTEKLASLVLGCKAAPGRFIKSDHAFDLLDASASSYTLAASRTRSFEAEFRVGGSIGKASGEPKARTITIALARALGYDFPEVGCTPVSAPARRRSPRSRSRIHGI